MASNIVAINEAHRIKTLMNTPGVRSVILPGSGYHAIVAHVHSGDDILNLNIDLPFEGTILYVPGVSVEDLMFVEAKPSKDGG